MKKMPTLFKREFHDHHVISISPDLTSPELAWVLAGEGVATEKHDGACCAIINGQFYKRYDAKRNKHGVMKTPPAHAIPCDDPDPITGHWPHWVLIDPDSPADSWFLAARANTPGTLPDGTYEAIGPHFNSNPYRFDADILVRHGCTIINLDRSFEGIRDYLEHHNIEGIVFWKDGAPQCKIKRKDFGFKWPAEPMQDMGKSALRECLRTENLEHKDSTAVLHKLPAPQRVGIYMTVAANDSTSTTSEELIKDYWFKFLSKFPNLKLMGFYMDMGWNSPEYRPERNRLFEDCRAGKIDLILTHSMAKFYGDWCQEHEIRNTLMRMTNPVDIYFTHEDVLHSLPDSYEREIFTKIIKEMKEHT